MELRCPKCNSTDLKKVSLAYQEGLYQGYERTRLSAALVGSGGPDLIVGRASTQTSRRSPLSKRLKPPVKWSYRKVIFWSALVFVCVGWLVFYDNTITRSATTVMSPALMGYILMAAVVFAFIAALVVRHNLSVYPKRLAEWDRSFICQCCGTVSGQNIGG
jgi:hypothetical protein